MHRASLLIALLLSTLSHFSLAANDPAPKRPVSNDPIRFTLTADKQSVAPGEELTLTITATDLNISSALLFTFADAKAFRLKVLMPNAFIQTGGDYSDYAGTTLSPEKPTQSYTIKGYFTDFTGESQFRLLRGSQNADATTLFVEKARLPITVIAPVAYAKAGRSGALSFQIVSYNCSSGVLQYQITGGDGSPVFLNLPGIIGSNVTAGNVLTHTFPGDARSGRTVTGTASQSGQQISINFTNGCNLSSSNSNPPISPNPPTNPNPSTGGSLSFQIVSYDCSSGVLRYQLTGGNGSPVSLNLPGIFGGDVTAGNVLTHTFPGDARSGRTVTGTASQSGQQISINFTNGCNLSQNSNPTSPTNPNPPTNPTPPTNPNPSTGGGFAFQIVSYDCSSGVLRYQITGGNGSPINLQLPGIIGGDVAAGNVLTHTFPGDARSGRTVIGTASQSGQQISINFTNGCNLSASNSNPSTNPNPPSNPAPSSNGCGTGSGLTGLYFNNADIAESPALIRVDGEINFMWGNDSPAPGRINPDPFSVHWVGQIEAPVTGNYTFKTNNDNATHLWVNGQKIIHDWAGHPPIWKQGSISLTGGQRYEIRINFADFGGGAQAQLYWEYPGQNLQIVPSCRLYPIGRGSQFDPAVGNVYIYQFDDLTFWADQSGRVYKDDISARPRPRNPARCPNLSPKLPHKAPRPKSNSDGDDAECEGDGGSGGTPTTPVPIFNPENPSNNPSTPNPGTTPGGPGGSNNSGNPAELNGQRVATTANVDVVDCDKVSGWAFANGGGHAFIDIYVTNSNNQVFKNTIKANNVYRADVRNAYGNNPNIPLDCGFLWAIPNEYKTGNSPLNVRVVPVNDFAPVMNGNKTTPGVCAKPGINPPSNTNPPIPQLPYVAPTVAEFYLKMSQRGIYFSEEERAVIAEYNLYERTKTFVDQYGRKPDGSNAFIMSDADQRQYPRFTGLVRSMPAFVEQHDRVKQALIRHTKLPWSKIKALLTFGSGPRISITNLKATISDKAYGHTIYPAYPEGRIEIEESFVRGLEQAFYKGTQEATAFLLTVTLLHELTHYGAVDGGRIEVPLSDEFGADFEREVLGTRINKLNADQLRVIFYNNK